MSGFVGRQAELVELQEMLGGSRLVTLTGPPGVGKTRLARELVDRYPDGAVFVDLAPIGDPALVERALSVALGVAEVAGRALIDTVVASLRRRASLVVLDNCEHLLDACRELTTNLLEGCPEVAVLATSREPLVVDAEQAWPVAPLGVPTPGESVLPEALMQFPSVRLFVERAGAAQPGFALNSYVSPAVAEVCRRLDGIPLAIELAAARVDMLTPAQIAARVEDRLDLLSGGPVGTVGRHETLEAALDWSYELLSSPERALLRRLSVFAGGVDAAAVEGVCAGDEVPAHTCGAVLSVLVSKSLGRTRDVRRLATEISTPRNDKGLRGRSARARRGGRADSRGARLLLCGTGGGPRTAADGGRPGASAGAPGLRARQSPPRAGLVPRSFP